MNACKKPLFCLAFTISILVSAPVAFGDAQSLLIRCMGVFGNQSSQVSEVFRGALGQLSAEDQKSFAEYLEMLMADVTKDSRHVPELSKDQKEKILLELLNSWNPNQLAASYARHRAFIAQFASANGQVEAQTLESLTAFADTFAPLSQSSAEEAAPVRGPGLSAPADAMLETPAGGFEALEAVQTEAVASESAPAQGRRAMSPRSRGVAPELNPTQVSVDREAIRRILKEEAFAVMIGSLFESRTRGSVESRMLSLLIARIERLLTTNQFDGIGILSAHPERPEILRTNTMLAQVFRDAEIAIRDYVQTKAKLNLYYAMQKSKSGFGAMGAEMRADFEADVSAEEAILARARQELGENLTVYLGVRTYLEEVVANKSCGLNCRIGALQILSNLGEFDIAATATQVQAAALDEHWSSFVADAAERDPRVQEALEQMNQDFAAYRNFTALDVYSLLKQDAELQTIRARATRSRATWGAVSVMFTSTWFRKLVTLVQKKYRLDAVPFMETYAQNSRDEEQMLTSIGPLLILARSNLAIGVKLSELEALAAHDPQILVTMHRHSLFRPLLAEAKKAMTDDAALKQKYEILSNLIDTAGNDPDATRPIDISFERSRTGKFFTAVFNTVALAGFTSAIVAPQWSAEHAAEFGQGFLNHFTSAPLDVVPSEENEGQKAVREVLNDNPEIANGLIEEAIRRSPL